MAACLKTANARNDDMNAAPMTDQDLDRLEGLLDDPALEDAMRLDEMQGFLCAALAGPQPLPDEEMIDEMIGEPGDLNAPAVVEAREFAGRLIARVREQLTSGEVVLWLYPETSAEDSAMDYGPWCMAYLHGVDLAGEDWFDPLDDEEAQFLDERLYPMMVLTGEAEAAAREHGEEWPTGEERDELTSDCQDQLPAAVAEIHAFWVAKRGAGTVRRELPKVGRNDPCPCGSGKKFKQCCGMAA
jgi:uncharacterized protein